MDTLKQKIAGIVKQVLVNNLYYFRNDNLDVTEMEEEETAMSMFLAARGRVFEIRVSEKYGMRGRKAGFSR